MTPATIVPDASPTSEADEMRDDTAFVEPALVEPELVDGGPIDASPGLPRLGDGVGADAGPHADRPRAPGRHRYTGPELSALLNQVRRELGAEASIVEANRVRSGGIAGFFAKEAYEVVAAPATRAPEEPPPPPLPSRAPVVAPEPVAVAEPMAVPEPVTVAEPTVVPEPVMVAEPAEDRTSAPVPVAEEPPAASSMAPIGAIEVVGSEPAATPGSNPTSPRSERDAGNISVALLERAEAISTLERVSIRQHDDDSAGQPINRPARFGEVLDAELASVPTRDQDPAAMAETSAVQSALRRQVVERSTGVIDEPASAETDRSATAPVEWAPIDALPVDALPVDALPVDALPVDALPVDALPVDALPVDALPVDALPVDALPVDALPVDALPVDSSPVEQAPVASVGFETLPVGWAPVDALPVDVVWASDPLEPVVEQAWAATSSPLVAGPSDPSPVVSPIGSRLTAIIGSVDAAMGVARRLLVGPNHDYAGFVVVALEPKTVDLPADRVGRHFEAVTRHLFDWAVEGEGGIVVVDAGLGDRLGVEVECLRNLGADEIVVIDDHQAPAIDTLQRLHSTDIEGTIVISAPGAGDPVTDGQP